MVRLAFLGLFALGLVACEDDARPAPLMRSYAPAPVSAAPDLEGDPEKEASDLNMETKAESVEPPWTVEALRAAIKPGRRWVLRESMVYFVGKDREEKVRFIEAEVRSIGKDDYRIFERQRDDRGQVIQERSKKGIYTFEGGTYSRLAKKETEVGEEDIEIAGRRWRAKVYRNRKVIDGQEQIITIWSAADVPGMALKMLSKSPRMTHTIELTEFQEGA